MNNKSEMPMHVCQTTTLARRAATVTGQGQRRAAVRARELANSGRVNRMENGANDGHADVLRTWLASMTMAEKAYRPRRRRTA